jgi:hypothetical protein
MTKKFMIHYCPGAGGMFLTSVFAKIMNVPIKTKISPTGDCHDFGNGVWNSYQNVVMNHIFDPEIRKMKLMYTPGKRLYLGHAMTYEFVEQHPDISVVQISAEPDDYYNISLMAIKKGWPNLWTKEEYNKWVGPDYPPYSPNNLAESDLICNDLLDYALIKQTTNWFEENADIKYSHQIDFKTVMGINNKNLVQEVANITGDCVNNDTCEFVNEYQQLNKKLYWGRSFDQS